MYSIFDFLLSRVASDLQPVPTVTPFSAYFSYHRLFFFLSSSTEVKLGKKLVRISVEFDKKMVYGNQSFVEREKWAKMGKLFQKFIVFFWICLWCDNKKISRDLSGFARLQAEKPVATERVFRRRTKKYAIGVHFILCTLQKIVQFLSLFLCGVRVRWSLPQGAWRGAEVLLHVADEIVCR